MNLTKNEKIIGRIFANKNHHLQPFILLEHFLQAKKMLVVLLEDTLMPKFSVLVS